MPTDKDLESLMNEINFQWVNQYASTSPVKEGEFRNRRTIIQDRDRAILEILAKQKILGKHSVDDLLESLHRSDLPIAEFLIRRDILADHDWSLPAAIAQQAGLRVIDRKPESIESSVAQLLPAGFARLHRLVAVEANLAIAVEDSRLRTYVRSWIFHVWTSCK